MPGEILITRPRPEADRLARELESRGFVPFVEPLLEVERTPFQGLRGDAQAVLLTSANAAWALASVDPPLPVLAVGDATAKAARAAGAGDVVSAKGAARDLANLVAARCRPGAGPLVHLCGAEVRPGLDEALAAAGFQLHRAVVYRAVPAAMLSPALRERLERRALAAVLLFSPRSAAILVDRILRYDLARKLDGTDALCLSAAVAGPCAALDWRRIAVARRPSRQALLELLEGSGRRW